VNKPSAEDEESNERQAEPLRPAANSKQHDQSPLSDMISSLRREPNRSTLITIGATGRDQQLNANDLLRRIGGVTTALERLTFPNGTADISVALMGAIGPSIVAGALGSLLLGANLAVAAPTEHREGLIASSQMGKNSYLRFEHSDRLGSPTSFDTQISSDFLQEAVQPGVLNLDELPDHDVWLVGRSVAKPSSLESAPLNRFDGSSVAAVSVDGESVPLSELVDMGRRALREAVQLGETFEGFLTAGPRIALGNLGLAQTHGLTLHILFAALEVGIPIVLCDASFARRQPNRTATGLRSAGVTHVFGDFPPLGDEFLVRK
jgi:hypothetical protein